MLLRSAIFLIFLAICPSLFCNHTSSSNTEESTQVNGTQSANSSNRINWQLKKTHLHIYTKPPKTLDASEGESKYLECLAGGIPPPTIHWLKDGILIQGEATEECQQKLSSTSDSNSTKRFSLGIITSRLYLDCLSVEDEGEYTSVVENPYHRMSTSTNLAVLSSDEEIECGNKSHGQAPRIKLWTRSVFSWLGDEARLMCRVNGYPRPTIRWLGPRKEELTNEDFDKYEVLSKGDLIVRNSSWSDMGTYSCIAENVHGESEIEVFLYPRAASTQVNGSQSTSD